MYGAIKKEQGLEYRGRSHSVSEFPPGNIPSKASRLFLDPTKVSDSQLIPPAAAPVTIEQLQTNLDNFRQEMYKGIKIAVEGFIGQAEKYVEKVPSYYAKQISKIIKEAKEDFSKDGMCKAVSTLGKLIPLLEELEKTDNQQHMNFISKLLNFVGGLVFDAMRSFASLNNEELGAILGTLLGSYLVYDTNECEIFNAKDFMAQVIGRFVLFTATVHLCALLFELFGDKNIFYYLINCIESCSKQKNVGYIANLKKEQQELLSIFDKLDGLNGSKPPVRSLSEKWKKAFSKENIPSRFFDLSAISASLFMYLNWLDIKGDEQVSISFAGIQQQKHWERELNFAASLILTYTLLVYLSIYLRKAATSSQKFVVNLGKNLLKRLQYLFINHVNRLPSINNRPLNMNHDQASQNHNKAFQDNNQAFQDNNQAFQDNNQASQNELANVILQR